MSSLITKFLLTIVTEAMEHQDAAVKLSGIIVAELGDAWTLTGIEDYTKLEHSYKINLELTLPTASGSNSIHDCIALSDRIASPWMVYYDDSDNSVELIYNKTSNSRPRNAGLDAIRWGHWQMIRS